jgi:zinc protease
MQSLYRRIRMGGWLATLCAGTALAGTVVRDFAFARNSEPTDTSAPPVLSSIIANPQDPSLTVGTLPNGMRYYIRVNKSPAKRVELRLAVNVGSLQEDDDQLGFAHFLEHMAFNGTTHFPQNQVVDFVEKAGMNFGADLNAYTSFDETVYMLTLPTDDPSILKNGLQIFQDWASGGITIDSNEVLAERGVVLGEWRSRTVDTANLNFQRHQDSVLFGLESRYHTRRPIGLPESIEGANPAPLKRFYRDWYRPDLMAIIVVGDFDKAEMEREIKARFGSIPAPDNPRPRPSSILQTKTEPVIDVYRGNVYPGIDIFWSAPKRPTEAAAAIRQELLEQLVLGELQRTFFKLRVQERRPFYNAGIGRSQFVRGGGDIYMLNILAWPDSLESGLAAALSEIERLAQHGLPPTALERNKEFLLRRYERMADGEQAIRSDAFASEYVYHYLIGEGVLLSPQQRLAAVKEILPTITSQDIANMAKFWRNDQSFTLLYKLPKFAHVRIPTRESLLGLMDSVKSESLAAKPDTTLPIDAPLMSKLPARGKIVKERKHAKAGVIEWTLSNGARVLYKPTAFHPDEFFIHAVSEGGTSLLPDSLAFSPGRLVGTMMTAAGGLGTVGSEQLRQQRDLMGLFEFEVALNYTDESIKLGGSPKHLSTLFQQLYLQFTEPKLDTAAVKMWKRYGYETLTQSINDQLAQTFSNGNRRLFPPAYALVDLVDPAQAMRIYQDRFGDAGDFTFILVGAASPDRVRPLVEQYVASLPSLRRPERERAKSEGTPPWFGIYKETPRIQHVPRTSTFLTFDGEFPTDPATYLRERQRLTTLNRVVNRRLRNELRERLGGTYGVGVISYLYATPEEHFRFMIQFDADPRRANALTKVMFNVLDSIRETGATEEELATIATIQRRGLETQLQSNSYWLSTIRAYDRLGIPLDRIPDPYPSKLTAAEVSSAAQEYLPKHSYVQITYLPIDTTYKIKTNTGAEK